MKDTGSDSDYQKSLPIVRGYHGSDTSRLMFVPKNYKTTRSICMEPNAFMFFQQGIMLEFVNAIRNSLLGNFCKIEDQTWNQCGAIYGSENGKVDTIDLSAASDSVHIDLVRAIFPRHWLHLMLASRTSSVQLPDGTTRKVHKFAPMGSALCFPVQSVIYLLVVIYAYMRYQIGPAMNSLEDWSPSEIRGWILENISSHFSANDSYFESIAVYGDDIICDSRTTDDVMLLLDELGFIVNHDKSFQGQHPMRESCGIFAFDGIDVTPYTFKVKSFSGRFNARALQSLISLTNLAGDYKLGCLHQTLIHFILDWSPPKGCSQNPVVFSNKRDDSFAIFSKKPRNSHLKRRYYDPDKMIVGDEVRASCTHILYQREEVRHYVFVPRKRIRPDDIRNERQLLHWDWYSKHMAYRAAFLMGNNHDNDFVTVREDVHKNIVTRWRWTPPSET